MRYLGPVHFRYAPGSTASSDLEGLARTFLGQLQGAYPNVATKCMYRSGNGWAMRVLFSNGTPVVDITVNPNVEILEQQETLFDGQYFFVYPRYTLADGGVSDVFSGVGIYQECLLRYNNFAEKVDTFSSSGGAADYAYKDRFYPAGAVARFFNGSIDWQGANGHIVTWDGERYRYFYQGVRSTTLYIGGISFTPNGGDYGPISGAAVLSGGISSGGYEVFIVAATGVGGLQLIKATATIATKRYIGVAVVSDIPGNYNYNTFFNSDATEFVHTRLVFSTTYSPPTSTLNMHTTAVSYTTYGIISTDAQGGVVVESQEVANVISYTRAPEATSGVSEGLSEGVIIASDYSANTVKHLFYNYETTRDSYTPPGSDIPSGATIAWTGFSSTEAFTWHAEAWLISYVQRTRVWLTMGNIDIPVIDWGYQQNDKRVVDYFRELIRTASACVGGGFFGDNVDSIDYTYRVFSSYEYSFSTWWVVDIDLRVGYVAAIKTGDTVTSGRDDSGEASHANTGIAGSYSCTVSPPPTISLVVPEPEFYNFLAWEYDPVGGGGVVTHTGDNRFTPTIELRLNGDVESTSFLLDTQDDGFPSINNLAGYRLAYYGTNTISTTRIVGDISSGDAIDLRFMLTEHPNDPRGRMKDVISIYYADLAFEDPSTEVLQDFRADVSAFRNTLGTWDRNNFWATTKFLLYPQISYLTSFVGSDMRVHTILDGEDVTDIFSPGATTSYTPMSVISFRP